MNSDRLFVYGTLMRGFDHPMAQLLSRSADFLGAATCRGRLYLIKHYPGLVLSDAPADIVFGELYRLRDRDALLGEFDMYEACGEGFPEPTEYVRRMLSVTHADGMRLTYSVGSGKPSPQASYISSSPSSASRSRRRYSSPNTMSPPSSESTSPG